MTGSSASFSAALQAVQHSASALAQALSRRGWLPQQRVAPWPAAGAARGAQAYGCTVPDALCLSLPIVWPQGLTPVQRERAFALQAQAASPFDAQDLLWVVEPPQGSGPDATAGRLHLASRSAVATWLSEQPSPPGLLLVAPAGAAPGVVFPIADAARVARQARRRQHLVWGLALATLLIWAGAALSPSVQLWWQARQAVALQDQIARQAAPALQLRAQTVALQERLAQLQSESPWVSDPLTVLDTLTAALPDDVQINRLDWQQRTLRLSGSAPNAAALIQSLGQVPGVAQVRAPTATVRAPGAARDSFTLELVWEAP